MEKQKWIADIEKKILLNWEKKYSSMGIKRAKLIKLSNAKKWKVRRVLASMRKRKVIVLYRKNYFVK